MQTFVTADWHLDLWDRSGTNPIADMGQLLTL